MGCELVIEIFFHEFKLALEFIHELGSDNIKTGLCNSVHMGLFAFLTHDLSSFGIKQHQKGEM